MIHLTGAREEIREHMTNPTSETELNVWKRIVPLMYTVKHMYDFSQELDKLVLEILPILCGSENA